MNKTYDRPCLYFQIGQCSAPCTGKITQNEYKELVDEVLTVLSGKYESLIEDLQKKMMKFQQF